MYVSDELAIYRLQIQIFSVDNESYSTFILVVQYFLEKTVHWFSYVTKNVKMLRKTKENEEVAVKFLGEWEDLER